ncbi:MAG TPA: ACT domain-containing protein, partial [Desulfocapsa sulfexigens]|nr:ACT domain-containing protein [Desulfocapsa sulfexigens]
NVLLYGLGAGMMPTGSAVAADVVDMGRNILCGSVNRVPALSYLPKNIGTPKITPMSELTCPYYFRITALDKPGVLATISGIFSKHAISIKSVIQKSRHELDPVSIVIHSHMANEAAVQASITEIDALDVCTEKTVKIRILADDE